MRVMTNYHATAFLRASQRSRYGVSEVSRNRAPLGCLIRQIDFDLVDIAPTLPFWRIISLYDWMAGCVEMGLRMPVR
ncbi:MAG: hypothetical protein JWM36_3043 [Hyphomicrobiales bacterium]|nr:hypothetical protein [Hyphomicrobiales bacterium]